MVTNRSAMITEADDEGQVMHTSFTQEVLCYLVRLLLELHLFRNHNKRAVARFLGSRFTTVRKKTTDATDVGGVYSLLFSPSLATVAKTEDILHQLLKRLQVWKQSLKTTGKGPIDETSESW